MDAETILCVATRVWDSLWRDSQQIMSRLAAHNRVLYFEPGRNPDRRHSAEVWRNWPNFLSVRVREVQRNLTVIPTPPCLPYASRHLPQSLLQVTTPRVATVNALILIRHIRQAMRALRVESPILWLYDPRQIDLVGKFGEKMVCYFNYDEYPDFAHNKRIKELLRQYDNRMSRAADFVFATSRGQWERRKKLNPSAYFIPNGVDFDLFHRALDPTTAVPAPIAGLNRPIIGYAGWLGYQIDVSLLVRVAEAYRDASVVLVGPDCLPDDETSRRLRSMSNVFFAGQQELQDLPPYLKAFDVAMIPYILGGHTLTVYPLKLHEYLAAGRAIVTTGLPELRPYSPLVYIGETHEEFVDQLGKAILDNGAESIQARVDVARQNTWDERVAEINRILQHRLSTGEREHLEEHVHRVDAVSPAE